MGFPVEIIAHDLTMNSLFPPRGGLRWAVMLQGGV